MNEVGAARVPHPLRHSDLRRRDRRGAVLPSARRQHRSCSTCASGARRSAGSCRRATVRVEPLRRCRSRRLRGVLQGHRGAQGVDDDGVRADAVEAAARQGNRRPDRADRARRGAHLRHGGALPRTSASTRTSARCYEPVDMDTLLYYKEAQDGQILEEGITEAGSMSSFIAAGTAYATHGVNTIPFFIYYSMFGFQRVGDLIWAAGDSRTRGFLLGGTAGRTTLAGEGLQHQDGNSHAVSLRVPELRRLRSGVRLRAGRDHQGRHPADVRRSGEHLLLPDRDERAVRDAAHARGRREDGILKGHVPLQAAARTPKATLRAQLFGSGAILNEVVKAQELLDEVRRRRRRLERDELQELYRDGHACERWNMLHPDASRRACRTSTQCLDDAPGVLVAASDYLKVLPDCHRRAGLPRRIRVARHRRLRPQRGPRRRSATSSRSTRATSRSPRCRRWSRKGQIDADGRLAGHQGPAGSIPTNRIPRFRR